MKIVLVNLPVHIPTVMPYSLTMMSAVLCSSLNEDIVPIDLNSLYHYKKFNHFYKQLGENNYFDLLKEFVNETRHQYKEISKSVLSNNKPELQDFLVKQITKHNPDIVAFSLTYNSQMFFATSIIDELINKGLKVVIGGPADSSKINKKAIMLNNYQELIEYLEKNGANKKENMTDSVLDFSQYNKEEYFTTELIYPYKIASSCPYKLCTFCTHHSNLEYNIFGLEQLKETIVKSKIKKLCLIDDCFTSSTLKEISKILKPYNVKWWCQLRPIKDMVKILPKLYESGLRSVSWGVESGSQRILDKMIKGTKVEDISKVLEISKQSGIINQLYVMFGLPTETKDEFMQTIEFLEKNESNIDLISPSVFGLQKGSIIYEQPNKFGVDSVTKTNRTVLGQKIIYEPSTGLTQKQAMNLKKKNLGKINNINKIPKIINSAKEQVLNYHNHNTY